MSPSLYDNGPGESFPCGNLGGFALILANFVSSYFERENLPVLGSRSISEYLPGPGLSLIVIFYLMKSFVFSRKE